MQFLYDTHAHLDDEMFDADRHDVIKKIKSSGIGLVNNIGASIESSRASIALAEKYDFIRAVVGVHPSEVNDMTERDIETIREMASHPKVVAIGEIGLDYHYDDAVPELQKKWFRAQLDLAASLNMPVVIHDRDSKGECIEILKEKNISNGVVHCFSGSAETAKQILDMGLNISFTGVLTFKNAKRAIEALKVIPIERLFIETDCPYMAPEPHRGTRNDSSLVCHIAEKIAEIKGLTYEDVVNITTQNAIKFFKP
ncbi:MAG: TatD family hydrolase [Clostridia bacterium]|nr:TatD family hydrolase [Clostridia bacterium]MBQ9737804.1 TatD family hydrolase [Clostridia bacterium]